VARFSVLPPVDVGLPLDPKFDCSLHEGVAIHLRPARVVAIAQRVVLLIGTHQIVSSMPPADKSSGY
jgi:hypothetical protein